MSLSLSTIISIVISERTVSEYDDNKEFLEPEKSKNEQFITDEDILKFVEDDDVALYSRGLETFFTISIIFSTTLLPFVMLQIAAPKFMTVLFSSVFVWALIPYAIIMIIVGLKIADLFGCSAWKRITNAKN